MYFELIFILQILLKLTSGLSVQSSNSNIQNKQDSVSYLNYRNSFLIESTVLDDLKQELTCFTCDQSISNDECNRKAIDEPCQLDIVNPNRTIKNNKNFACLTIHKLNSLTLETLSIEKQCSLDCRVDMVGCSSTVLKSNLNNHQHIRICTYCCNKNYCNMDAARSIQETIQLSSDFMLFNNTSLILINYYTCCLYLSFLLIIFTIKLV